MQIFVKTLTPACYICDWRNSNLRPDPRPWRNADLHDDTYRAYNISEWRNSGLRPDTCPWRNADLREDTHPSMLYM